MADGQTQTADRTRRSLGPLRRLAPYLARYPRLVAGALVFLTLAAVTLGNALACVLALPWALPVGAITTPDLGLVVYLGAIQIGLAYVFLTHGFRHVPAFEASLLILVEPTLSPIWAWLIHHEVPGWLAIAGGVVVLGATTAKTWLDQRARRLAPP